MAADNTKTFNEYISEQVETGAAAERDDPVGDFILDAEADSFFPGSITADPEGFAKIVNYLYYNRGGWDGVMEALMDTWSEYYREVTGSKWIEDGYSRR